MASTWTRARTSTAPAACSTSWSPAARRSPGTARSPWPTSTCARTRDRRRTTTRRCPRPSTPSCSRRWPSCRCTATSRPSSCARTCCGPSPGSRCWPVRSPRRSPCSLRLPSPARPRCASAAGLGEASRTASSACCSSAWSSVSLCWCEACSAVTPDSCLHRQWSVSTSARPRSCWPRTGCGSARSRSARSSPARRGSRRSARSCRRARPPGSSCPLTGRWTSWCRPGSRWRSSRTRSSGCPARRRPSCWWSGGSRSAQTSHATATSRRGPCSR